MGCNAGKCTFRHVRQAKIRVSLHISELCVFDTDRGIMLVYCNKPKFWDRQGCANSLERDKVPQNAASDQDLHCLPPTQHFFLNTLVGGLMELFKF